MSELTKDARDYLRSLVRMDIRKKDRGLAKFAPKVGQDAKEAEAVRADMQANVEFRRAVLAQLEDYTPARFARATKALDEITVLAEYGTTGPRTNPPCKSPKLTAEQATSLRGSISTIAREALKGTPYEARQ